MNFTIFAMGRELLDQTRTCWATAQTCVATAQACVAALVAIVYVTLFFAPVLGWIQ